MTDDFLETLHLLYGFSYLHSTAHTPHKLCLFIFECCQRRFIYVNRDSYSYKVLVWRNFVIGWNNSWLVSSSTVWFDCNSDGHKVFSSLHSTACSKCDNRIAVAYYYTYCIERYCWAGTGTHTFHTNIRSHTNSVIQYIYIRRSTSVSCTFRCFLLYNFCFML